MLPPGWSLTQPTGINDAGQVIGVGVNNGVSHGVLLTPALVCNPSSFKIAHGTVTLTISGLNGQTVILQASCDLLNWDPVATNVISRNKTTFTDSGTCASGTRCYRAVVQ